MAVDIVVPQVSDGVTSGTVISVAVAVGEQVSEDQTLLELETDKAVVAIPSPAAGQISAVHVAVGEEVAVGAVIMVLEPSLPQEDRVPQAEELEPAPERLAGESLPARPRPSASQGIAAKGAEYDVEPDPSPRRSGHLVAPAAPSVRRIARDLGVDIYQVQGTGPGGRISEKDVRGFVRSTMSQVTGAAAGGSGEFRRLPVQRPLPDFGAWGEVEREPLSRIRQVTANAMGYAWSTIPMVTQYDRAQVDALETFRQEFNERATDGRKLTVTAILLKVCAAALKHFPRFNSSLDLAAQELIYKRYVHIGVAVDTPAGLLVPVLHDVGKKGLATLAAELNELAVKARERKLTPAEMDGGTFTISNLGGIGGSAFTPLVYPPQVAILGVSRAETQPYWNGHEFVPRQMLPLSLSYDHRVIDGADGARFLRWICAAIEQPLHLLEG